MCATNFTVSRPNQTIQNALLRQPALVSGPKLEEIDLTHLSSDDPFDTMEIGPDGPRCLEGADDNVLCADGDVAFSNEGSDDNDVLFVKEYHPNLVRCDECGCRLFPFSASAHQAFHESERTAEKAKEFKKKRVRAMKKHK